MFAKGRRPTFCSARCLSEYDRIFQPLFSQAVAARRFAEHAKKTECVFYLLALKLICWVLAEFRRTGDSCRAAAPLRVLYGRPYWDAVDAPDDAAAAREARSRLQEDTEQSRLLAIAALGAACPLPAGWPFLDPEGYAHLLGALCCNAIAVVYATPVVHHVLQIDAMVECDERQEAMVALEPFVRALLKSGNRRKEKRKRKFSSGDDSDSDMADGGPQADERQLCWSLPGGRQLEFSTSLFPSYKGYAVFPRLALANHSCAPNCAVEFTFAGSMFLLTQPQACVSAGDELTISYLDASLGTTAAEGDADRARRRRLLQPYGFVCSCAKCGQVAHEPPFSFPRSAEHMSWLQKA